MNRRRHGYFAGAALTLGLSLAATQAFAGDYRIINGSGVDIKMGCAGSTIGGYSLSTGQTGDYSCNTTFYLQKSGGDHPEYTIPYDCPGEEITEVTVRLKNDRLFLSHQCIVDSSDS